MAQVQQPTINLLPRGKFFQVAYKLTLLDIALIRSNGPDEIMTRNVGGEDRFIIPASKIRHGMREFLERIQRSFDMGLNCRAQHYCSACPACWVYGTLGSTGDNRKTWSLSSHINMTEAIAMKPGTALDMRTTNAVDPETMKTNKSLTRTFGVPAGTEFYGFLSLTSVHPDAVRLALSSLLGVTRVGARTAVNGLCKIEILAVKESFVEDTTWSPHVVALTGQVPTGNPSPVSSLSDPGAEDALIESLQRFYKDTVEPTIQKLSGSISSISKIAASVTSAMAIAETKGDTKALTAALKKFSATPEVKESIEAAGFLESAKESLANKDGNMKTNIAYAAQAIRDALSTLGCLESQALPTGSED